MHPCIKKQKQAPRFRAGAACGHTLPDTSSSARAAAQAGEGAQLGTASPPFPGMLTVVPTPAFLFLSSRQCRCLDQLLLKINSAFKMKLALGHQTVIKARELVLKINVIFSSKKL